MSVSTAPRQNLAKKLAVPVAVFAIFLALGLFMWRASDMLAPLLFFGYIGLSLGVGLGLYAVLPKQRKPLGRRLTLFLIGGLLFVSAAFLFKENMQIEGFFFYLFAGVFQAAVSHYLIAKVFGPLLIGRLWCGWACWTVMVLDLLPWQRPQKRLPAQYGWLRYIHFAVSLLLMGGLFLAGYRMQPGEAVNVYWFLGGNAFYYLTGIGLAYALKDNRAFCKYLCPLTVLLKLGARFSMLKIAGNQAACTSCKACEKACPMDVPIVAYTQAGRRVASSECVLCQTCITACDQDALKLSFKVGK